MPANQDKFPLLTDDPIHARVPQLRADPHPVRPDVLMHTAFVNTYAVVTSAGLLLIDPGLQGLGTRVHEAVRDWSDAPLHTAVYTHGHSDHAFGLGPWLEAGERPQIIAQENCVARFQRYHLTHGFNAIINQRQFSLPRPTFPDEFDWPTITVRDSLVQRIGDTEVRYRAAKGETDDALYAWLPERGYLFTGDLIVWTAPNCGNPQKVQRYPLEWAEALEEMAGLGADWLFPGHGLVVEGADGVRTVLTETAAWLRSIIDQVLERMNSGQSPEQIFHEVDPDPELSKRPFLRVIYDDPKFIVRNLVQLWGGWWNGNAADLLPATWAEQGGEIAELAGGVDALVVRGRELIEQGNLPMACHVAEWATRGQPADTGAQELKRDAYGERLAAARQLMAQGIYRAAMNDAIRALGGEPEAPGRLPL
jgi:glyoxylase-like metal-dependent hydrolase (beta-lactamase superfamily II)